MNHSATAFRLVASPAVGRSQRHHGTDELQSVSAAALEVLDRLAFGVLLLDESGRVLFANEEARRIRNRADAIRFTDGRLRATVRTDDATLQRLIQDATSKSQRKPLPVGGAAVLGRQGGKSPVQVLVAPLKGTAPFAESQRVAVFLTDPTRRLVPPSEVLRACFGFSPAETRVVRELLEGRSVKEISAQLSLTENTVRSYFKAILTKTGCRSQSALVGLLLRSVAALRCSERGER